MNPNFFPRTPLAAAICLLAFSTPLSATDIPATAETEAGRLQQEQLLREQQRWQHLQKADATQDRQFQTLHPRYHKLCGIGQRWQGLDAPPPKLLSNTLLMCFNTSSGKSQH